MKKFKLFCCVILLFIISGCATVQENQKIFPQKNYTQEVDKQSLQKEHNEIFLEEKSHKKSLSQPQRKSFEPIPNFIKKDDFVVQEIKRDKETSIVKLSNDSIKLDIEKMPLNEFLNFVFGKILKVSYIVEPALIKNTTPVTLHMTKNETIEKFFVLVRKLLKFYGVQVSEKNGVYYIFKSKRNSSELGSVEDIVVFYGKSIPKDIDDNLKVLVFVPYDYIDPSNTVNMLRAIGIQKVRFYYYINKMQTMFGPASEVRKALRLVQLIDRPYMANKLHYLLYLDNISSVNFVEKVKSILQVNNIPVSKSVTNRGMVLLPIEELNMVYVITPKKSWLKLLLFWKKKLDIQHHSQKSQLFIYHVKNRKVEELAKVIGNIMSFSSGVLSSQENNNSLKTRIKKVSISFDKTTNILMFFMPYENYKRLKRVVERLDRLPLQTLVEVTVAQVDMTDSFSLGFEYALQNYSQQIGEKALKKISLSNGLFGAIFKGNYLNTVINMFAEKRMLDIISRPKILILNNNTGSINVGTQVPVVISEVSATDINGGNTPTINRNIQYRNTGIILNLTPTINSDGVVTMDISIDLSEAQTNSLSKIDSPLIVNRNLKTTVVIKSGDTILIGGLISHKKSLTNGGVPYIKDIPLLGSLFSSKSHKVTKTELIMLIRPLIIKNNYQMSYETRKFESLLKYIRSLSL